MDKKNITIKEVAEYANVSQATVSRVINGQSSVKEANLVKVHEAIAKLGYTPNPAAKALATSRSNSIGMLVGSLDGPFYGPLMHAAEDEIYKLGLHLIVTSGQDSEQKELESLHFLRAKQVEGVIVHADRITDEALRNLSNDFKHFVLLNRHIPELENHCLYLDNELGGYLATKHLLDFGHKAIGCITGPMNKHDARDRLLGYIRALAEHGVSYDPNLTIEGRFDHFDNFDKAKTLLERAPDITAVFCQNDNIALAVYDACYELGRTVGKDISIVGFDNDFMSRHMRPRLTTVGFPISEMGKIAGKMIIDQVKGQDRVTNQKLMPTLEVHDSVARIG
ncbi:LacI family DNA-binding transcriptional regulator [Vibrio hippocampi]|uniref:HTH-type transcriptional regulator GalR n=1 Tax=Vibrio hippocampi TaxID=654686 RepID=A0ABN8DM31_9VIBR|nr:LacI family DNA-binding transcriptional regulator [Vibrio hippocampi]CAH0529405.1 HTH-type transcriptional regulator GalR [Vibrio hippocampi]